MSSAHDWKWRHPVQLPPVEPTFSKEGSFGRMEGFFPRSIDRSYHVRLGGSTVTSITHLFCLAKRRGAQARKTFT
jgi:hypothetical protein